MVRELTRMLAFVFLIAFLAPLAALARQQPQTRTAVIINDNDLGFSFCTNSERARAYAEVDIILSNEGPMVVAHELRHKRDVQSVGCERFLQWIESDPQRNGALYEARAYCESLRVAQRPPLNWTRSQALANMAMRLAYGGYTFGLNEKQASDLIESVCPIT